MSYNYLLAARIIQGFSTSAYESLLVSLVGDMYFVHQRGTRIAIINFITNAASSLSSIICGQVFAHLGWLWLFHMFQIFLCIQMVLMLLFCPETTYIRDHQYDIDQVLDEDLDKLAKTEYRREHKDDPELVHQVSRTSTARDIPTKKTFVQELAIWTRVYSKENFLLLLAGPFITLLNPAALYAIIASGLILAWYVGSSIIVAGVFAGAPWFYNPAQIGYIGAGPVIGGMIGSIFVALTSDPIAKRMTMLNNGI